MIFFDVDVSDVEIKRHQMESRMSNSGIRAFLLGVMYPYLRDRLARRFEGEGDDASGAWADLSDVTVRIRESMGLPGAHPINVRRGGMKSHLLSSKSITEGGRALNIPGALTGKTRQKVAMAQKGGGTAPARPVLVLSGVDRALGTNALLNWVMKGGTAGSLMVGMP